VSPRTLPVFYPPLVPPILGRSPTIPSFLESHTLTPHLAFFLRGLAPVLGESPKLLRPLSRPEFLALSDFSRCPVIFHLLPPHPLRFLLIAQKTALPFSSFLRDLCAYRDFITTLPDSPSTLRFYTPLLQCFFLYFTAPPSRERWRSLYKLPRNPLCPLWSYVDSAPLTTSVFFMPLFAPGD